MKDHATHAAGRDQSAPILQTSHLTKNFGGLPAVHDVSLSLTAGGLYGLIGPNGAGKTTLFDMLGGDQRPSSGQIHVFGRAVQSQPAHARLAAGLGRTFQIPRPFAAMTVLENVMLGAQGHPGERLFADWLLPRRVARAENAVAARARELLRFVDLESHALEPARVLSGGQRKLLELARLLMAEPAIVLLDEPAAGVSPALLDIIMERIALLNARGTTFLIVEHNMALVTRLCRQVFVMAGGTLLTQGTPQEVVRDARVIDAYLGGPRA